MASRRRTLLFALAVGFGAALVPAAMAGADGARLAQDGTATFGGQSTVVSTTVVASTSSPAASTGDTQTVVETPDPPATRLLTESRKVAAVIAGLVIVALALALLTVRYWRQTKPLPLPADVEADEPVFVAPTTDPASTSVESVGPAESVDASAVAEPVDPGGAAEPGERTESVEADETAAVEATVEDEDATEVSAASGPDHPGVDADWEPRTGEHPVVRPAAVSLARPTASLRRRALGLPDET